MNVVPQPRAIVRAWGALAGAVLLCAAVVAAWPSGVAAEANKHGTPAHSVSQGTFYVRPLGEVDRRHIAMACDVIRNRFQFRCRALRWRPLPLGALDAHRYQYDANALLEVLFRELPSDAVGMVGLTNADLYEPRHGPFVFGLASLIDHVAVASLARYRSTWWGETPLNDRFDERFEKVLTHEIAHTLGVPHCGDQRCIMREDRTIADLDSSPRGFCKRCGTLTQQGQQRRPGTAFWHYTRGHSHLNRGQFAQAVYHFERSAALQPDNPQFQNDLGVAYLRRGDVGRALWSFRDASRLDPTFAYSRYNEGLIFSSVGDVEMAWEMFHAVLSIDPDWPLAHRQLGYLALEAMGERDLALRHFERYLASHGADPSVEDRIRVIKGGGRSAPGH